MHCAEHMRTPYFVVSLLHATPSLAIFLQSYLKHAANRIMLPMIYARNDFH